jgi:hypothetical protein
MLVEPASIMKGGLRRSLEQRAVRACPLCSRRQLVEEAVGDPGRLRLQSPLGQHAGTRQTEQLPAGDLRYQPGGRRQPVGLGEHTLYAVTEKYA